MNNFKLLAPNKVGPDGLEPSTNELKGNRS